MRLSEKFLAAANRLEQTSVIGGKFEELDDNGEIIGHCVLGALSHVSRPSYAYGDAVVALHRLLNIQPSEDNYNNGWGLSASPSGQVAAWSNNLADAGKGSEVIAGLRRAAELAKAEEEGQI